MTGNTVAVAMVAALAGAAVALSIGNAFALLPEELPAPHLPGGEPGDGGREGHRDHNHERQHGDHAHSHREGHEDHATRHGEAHDHPGHERCHTEKDE